MVLIKRPPYLAALEGYLELHRSVTVRLEDAAITAPLQNLPYLYQVWGTLNVIAAVLDEAREVGYEVDTQNLIGRDGQGVYVRVLPGGTSAVTLTNRSTGWNIRVVPEQTFGDSGQLKSISYPQRPDVTVNVTSPDGSTRLYLFDPKYKLDGELIEGESLDGKPRKVDIDKMHAYRDAIRDQMMGRVVISATTLYPGPSVLYAEGIEALSAYPGSDRAMHARLRTVLALAITAET